MLLIVNMSTLEIAVLTGIPVVACRYREALEETLAPQENEVAEIQIYNAGEWREPKAIGSRW